MKHARKPASLLLALIMVFAFASTAFAAGEPTSGTITVKNSENGTTYQFYRLLDLTLYDLNTGAAGYESYVYALNTKWTHFFTTGAGAAYLTDTNSGSLNAINVGGAVKYINITSANVVAFTNAAMQYALDTPVTADLTGIGNGSDLTVTANVLGYYLMIPVNASIKTEHSSGSIASLTSTTPDVEIQVKAVKPSIGKVDDTVSADIGKVVTYTITGTVPSTAGYAGYVYKISDEMTNGLTFNKDVSISIEGMGTITSDSGVSIDYETKTNAFTATIPVMNYQDSIGKTITLTYTAVVNENAVVHSQEKNKAFLEYGHKPGETEKTVPIEEEVYAAKITINKYTGDDASAAGAKLQGAKFALMNSEGKFYKYTAAEGDTPAKVTWTSLTGGPAANDTVAVTDAQLAVIAQAAGSKTITTYTTDQNGAAEFKGIADGDYYLVEYEAPAGYNRLQKAAKVTVMGTNADTTETENKAQASQTVFDAAQSPIADIQNQAGTTLPSTGGTGTTIFYFLGSMMALAAIVLLITKKRMNSAE